MRSQLDGLVHALPSSCLIKMVTYKELWLNGLKIDSTKKGNLVIIVFILELILIAMEMLTYAILGVFTFYIGYSIAVYRDWRVYKWQTQ